jgi:hypothetical protein
VSNASAIQLVIEGLAAFGTIALSILAIWGDWVRSKFAPAMLVIVPQTLRGDPTTTRDGRRVMYYHLRVVNQRQWLPIHNCRVLLKGLTKRGPDNQFHPVPMAVPLQFVWAPAEITPPVITLVNEQILDFGYVLETEKTFSPTLYSYAHNFKGHVQPNEAVRFQLQIEATNFSSRVYQVFEVAWDGNWSFVPEEMAEHLRIQEIH